MFSNNSICKLYKIKYPIIQAGMVWCSGWKLASSVSGVGGLGLIGAGSMTPDVLEQHVSKTSKNTAEPFGVNLPMIASDIEEKIEVIKKYQVPIVFTSAGNPAKWTDYLKGFGCIVTHVISSSRTAQKAIDAGVDALVAEGFEAGGHNGREETTSMALIPAVRRLTDLPLLAAGGMFGGRSLMAAQALGADGIQVGTRFTAAKESSAHERFKARLLEINEGDTRLLLKKLVPVRMIKNNLYQRLAEAEDRGAGADELLEILGRGKSRKGIFEGDLEEGELEIGQVASLLVKQESASEIVKDIISEYKTIRDQLCHE